MEYVYVVEYSHYNGYSSDIQEYEVYSTEEKAKERLVELKADDYYVGGDFEIVRMELDRRTITHV